MSITYNGTTISAITYNGTALTKVIYNGTTVWESASWHTVWTGNKITGRLVSGTTTSTYSMSNVQLGVSTRVRGEYHIMNESSYIEEGEYSNKSIVNDGSSYTTIFSKSFSGKSVKFSLNVKSAGKLGYINYGSGLAGDGTDGFTGYLHQVDQYY